MVGHPIFASTEQILSFKHLKEPKTAKKQVDKSGQMKDMITWMNSHFLNSKPRNMKKNKKTKKQTKRGETKYKWDQLLKEKHP